MTDIRCPECGRVWTCQPEGACWCKELPPVMPMPATGTAASCLCPCKLEAAIAAARTAKASPNDSAGS